MRFFKKSAAGAPAESQETPYLSARQHWNEHVGRASASRRLWQIVALFALTIALSAVAGVIYIGKQTKFVPYIVEVDKLGEIRAVARADRVGTADSRVIEAELASFIRDARIVTPDIALQRRAVFEVYGHLQSRDPATRKMNAWMGSESDNNPFRRASKETVTVEIKTVLARTAETYQLDWVEQIFSREGNPMGIPVDMRALVTFYLKKHRPGVTEKEFRQNPLGLFIRDFSWSAHK